MGIELILAAIVIALIMAITIAVLARVVIAKSKKIDSLRRDIAMLKHTHANTLKRVQFDVSQKVRAEGTNDMGALLREMAQSGEESELTEDGGDEKESYVNVNL